MDIPKKSPSNRFFEGVASQKKAVLEEYKKTSKKHVQITYFSS
jgi:hypothetical protein